MTKTTNIAAAIAIAASTFATGCAVAPTDCADAECVAADAQGAVEDAPIEVTEEGEGRLTASRVRDPQLKQYPRTIPPLRDWVLRMDAGTADDCDMRFAAYVAGEDDALELRGCENSIIAEIVNDGGRPVAVPFNAFNVEETRWMLLGLDISEDAPLSVEQERMLIEADDASIHARSAVTAQPVNGIEPAYAPENLAPHNM
jgi:hypothetical protein